MKVLFTVKSLAVFSYVSSIIEALDGEITVLFDREKSSGNSNNFFYDFCKKHKIIAGWMKRRGPSYRIVCPIREARSYLSYYGRGQSNYYRRRWGKLAPFWARWFGFVLRYFDWLFEIIENLIPPAKEVLQDIAIRKPDVIVASPANHRFSEEIEYIKAAKKLNIPTFVVVLSWDNLTTKGLFHVQPDTLLVWNRLQRKEAQEIHGIDNSKIVGAPVFDKWFKEVKDRLEPKIEPPYILYLGSSANIAPDETWLVEKLLEITDLNILVRPHPANYWNWVKLKSDRVVVHPRFGQLPEFTEESMDFYWDIKNSEFVFGINTSAMIDAIILDKPCVTLLADEYSGTQKMADHFKHMMPALFVCKDIEILEETITWLLEGRRDYRRMTRRSFVRCYIKPSDVLSGKNAAWYITDGYNRNRIGYGKVRDEIPDEVA